MGKPVLPLDQNMEAVQALRYVDGGAHVVAALTSGSVRSAAFTAGTRIVTVTSPVAVFFRVGDGTVVAAATDHYIPANWPTPIPLHNDDQTVTATNIAFLAASADGSVYISERN